MSYGWEDFAGSLLTAAQGALPYIGAGVAAGVVIFGVLLSIRAGIRAFQNIAYDQLDEYDYAPDWDEDQREMHRWVSEYEFALGRGDDPDAALDWADEQEARYRSS